MTEPPVGPEGSEEFKDFFHTDELPTGPVEQRERRSHRGERAGGPLGRRILAPLTAVVVVVVVILLLIWINGKPSGTGPGAGVISAPTGSTSPHVTKASGKHHKKKHKHQGGSSTPTAHATATPTSTPSASSRPTAPVGGGATSPADRNAMAPVDVLNNSTISGLAAHVASEVSAKGWAVKTVGNFPGLVAVTTVYFAPGEKAAAKHLEREFSSIQRIAPAGSAVSTPADGITLVLTKDWSG